MMKARQINLTLIVFIIGLLWFVDANAAIYKWRDENGKFHFTDDPSQVPEAFRKKPFIKSPKAQKKILNPEDKKVSDEEGATSKKEGVGEKTAEPEKKEIGKQEGLTEVQRSTAEAVVSFLKADIQRYEKFYSWPTSRSKFRAVKGAVASATPQKQTLLEQVSSRTLPLFEEIAGFLNTSIAEDEKSQKIYPTTITSRRQTQALMNRLKKEAGQETQLLEKLTTALSVKATP